MKIQITHPNPLIVHQTLNNVLNIACVVALGGFLPDEEEQRNPQRFGKFWYREGEKVHLAAISNDFWAWVTDETETSVTVEFSCRYSLNFNDSLCQLLFIRFRPDIKLINE